MKRSLAALLLAFLFFALAGCDKPEATENGSPAPDVSVEAPSLSPEVEGETHTAAPNPNAIKPEDVAVSVVDAEGYQAALDKLKGQVVLVDFWATWCEPCRENFSHIVALGSKHADDGLAVVSLSVDDPSSEAEVKNFLASQGAQFEHLISKFGSGPKSAEAFNMRGDVPLYRLYDREGKLRYQFTENEPQELEHGEPIEKLDERVSELLAEKES